MSAAKFAERPTVAPGEESGAERGGQFVIFRVQSELFAIPLVKVQEIIRVPDLVRMPLSPDTLEGLANLRGAVLPIINLRRVFNFEAIEHDEGTRVVVLDQGCPVGLVVDHMANVVTVDADAIDAAAGIQSTVDTALLTGLIKNRQDGSMVLILDAAALVKREFRGLARGVGPDSPAAIERGRDAGSAAEPEADGGAEDQLVSFDVAGQEYAFPIKEVQEIVQLPDRMAAVPNAAHHVLGVITLRNRLLPLISLRRMFSLPEAETTDAAKVVVVSLGADMSVGVVIDSIREVLRVNRSEVDAMPVLLSRNRSLDDISSICRLEEGRRLVSVLSAGRMFESGEVRAVAEAVSKEEGEAMGDGRDSAAADLGDEEMFVIFRLMDDEYGVPIASVQEIVRVPESLTRIPKTPDFIEGVINLRGTVLPVVDQRRRFGLAGGERGDRQRIMVFSIKGVRSGFIVDSVSEVMRIGARLISRAPRLSDEQQKLIQRVANLEAKERMILLLEVDQLLEIGELEEIREKVSASEETA